MNSIKELFMATAEVVARMAIAIAMVVCIIFSVAVIVACPILIVAGLFFVVCLIAHITFSWYIPVMIGLAILVCFGLATLE